ncbi:MAG TPA: hypothetical protein VL358_09030 [Caulobacteraceae bacterium]|jgi:hypothetical protein|nr:hypothetical protein [Caulobacteraceae bacterium]
MSDAVFFVMAGLLAAGAIALALVWPQGLGTPSPAPFGHPLAVEAAAPPVPAPAAVPPSSPPTAAAVQLKGAL